MERRLKFMQCARAGIVFGFLTILVPVAMGYGCPIGPLNSMYMISVSQMNYANPTEDISCFVHYSVEPFTLPAGFIILYVAISVYIIENSTTKKRR
jgi:hypothetical protein